MTATLQAADISPQTLRKAAAAAALAAEKGQPVVYAGMDDKAARSALQNHQRHEGKAIAAVLRQAARDVEAELTSSIGLEWDAKHTVRLEDGARALHPVIRHHAPPSARIRRKGALLLLDADANLGINRQLFGETLRGFALRYPPSTCHSGLGCGNGNQLTRARRTAT